MEEIELEGKENAKVQTCLSKLGHHCVKQAKFVTAYIRGFTKVISYPLSTRVFFYRTSKANQEIFLIYLFTTKNTFRDRRSFSYLNCNMLSRNRQLLTGLENI